MAKKQTTNPVPKPSKKGVQPIEGNAEQSKIETQTPEANQSQVNPEQGQVVQPTEPIKQEVTAEPVKGEQVVSTIIGTIPAAVEEKEKAIAPGIEQAAESLSSQSEETQPAELHTNWPVNPDLEALLTNLDSQPDFINPKPTLVNLQQRLETHFVMIQFLFERTNYLLNAIKDNQTPGGTQVQPASKKRGPASNGKSERIQIKDKTTGRIFKSKNNTYQTLLKEGALKELVDKKLFGEIPAKNNFGWFALNRACPDRFEEVKPESSTAGKEEAK